MEILDKKFEPYILEEEIQDKVAEMAHKINIQYRDKEPLFLSILNGSFIFAADLFKKIEVPSRISFIKYKSYSGTASTGKIEQLIGLSEDLEDQNVIVVEDIVDTGLTMHKIIDIVKSRNPKSFTIAALLLKPGALKRPVDIEFLGFKIPNEFVVGYGMDYNGFGRNIPEIYKVVKE